MPIQSDVLLKELQAAIADINGVDSSGNVSVAANRPLTSQEQDTVASIIATHEANYATLVTVTQQEVTQAANARNQLQLLTGGLHALPAQDKGYVVLARIMAKNDGANNATIEAIVDRATATAYVIARANWLAVPSAARPMLGDILEAHAVSISAVIAFLTG